MKEKGRKRERRRELYIEHSIFDMLLFQYSLPQENEKAETTKKLSFKNNFLKLSQY